MSQLLKMLLTTQEAAQACSLSEGYIKAALRSGELPKVKHGRCTRIRVEDLQRWNARKIVGTVADHDGSLTENSENQVTEKTVHIR